MASSDPVERVRELLRAGECNLFVGAGLSVPLGFPTGREVANRLANQLGSAYDGPRDDLAIVASATEALLGRHHLLSQIHAWFSAVTPGRSAMHDRLASLNLAALVTTNWDSLLEDAARTAGKNPTTVASDPDLPFSPGSQILKLHGDLTRLDTLVVTDFDTLQVPFTRPALLNHLRMLLLQHPTVFVGFSLADWDFRSTYMQCEQWVGRLLPRSYAVQLAPPRWLGEVWRTQHIEVVDCDVATLISTL